MLRVLIKLRLRSVLASFARSRKGKGASMGLAIGLIALLAAVFLFRSILLVALGNFLVTAVSLAGFMSASARYVGYRLGQQLEDVLRPLALAVAMGAAAWLAGRLPLAPLPLLTVQIAVGVAVYGLLAVLFARAQLAALLALVRRGGQKEGA